MYSSLQNNYAEPEHCSLPSSPPTSSPPVLSAPSAPLLQEINLLLPPPTPPSPEEYDCKQTAMQQCFKEGLHSGELHAYLEIVWHGQGIKHESLPFSVFKELKTSVMENGIQSSFTKSIFDTTGNLCYDSLGLESSYKKTVLIPAQFAVWSSENHEGCLLQTAYNADAVEMLE